MSDFSIMLCLRACAVLFVVVASDDDMLISVSEDGERFVRMPIHAQPLGFCVDHLPNTDPEICTRVIAEGVAARLDPNRDVVYPPSYASQNRWHYRSRIASPAPHDEASEFAASAPPSTHPPCKLLDELPRSGRGARRDTEEAICWFPGVEIRSTGNPVFFSYFYIGLVLGCIDSDLCK